MFYSPAYYRGLRRPYEPSDLRLLVVAESPPASGRYFYDPIGAVSEPLFSAIMKQLRVSPTSKEEGLKLMTSRGWLLVDATYEPVDKNTNRDAVILRDYETLRSDLFLLDPHKRVPVVLIKANVCRLLEPRLTLDGFRVLNEGRQIYFPSHGNQSKFHVQFSAVIKGAVRIEP